MLPVCKPQEKNSERQYLATHSNTAGEGEEEEEAAESTFHQALSQPRRSSWSFWAAFSSSDSMAAKLSIS